MPGIARSVHDLARPGAAVMAIVDHYRAIDQHIVDALRVLLGIFVGRAIGNPVGIEYHDIPPVSFAQQPAILQAEHLRRH